MEIKLIDSISETNNGTDKKITRNRRQRRIARSTLSILAAGTCALVSACGDGSSTAPPPPATSAAPTPTGQVAIVNNHLQRNGAPWIPHGYFQVAFQIPPGDPDQPAYLENGTIYYTPTEYTEMVNAGADSVRVMIAQTAADPQNPLYSSTMVAQFIGAVQAARAAGLTVIVGIQDESATGEQNPLYMPSAATQRAWSQLVPSFKNDKGIVLELFNEPGMGPTDVITPASWQTWAAAMNATIASVRSEGATNVLVADGLAHAEVLAGAPALTDPMNQVAYAAHPYAFKASDETVTNWQNNFGYFSETNPVIITEWGQGYYCGPTNPGALINFLNFLQNRGIGLEMGAWDWGGTGSFAMSRYNFPSAPVFSTYNANGAIATCGMPQRGPGLTVNAWYTTGVIPAAAL